MHHNVHLTLAGTESTLRSARPVSQGVPFPPQTVSADAGFTLRDGGAEEIPVQTRPLAFWDADRRWIKWLLTDFIAPSGAETVTLHADQPPEGSDRPAPRSARVLVQSDSEAVTVDTGRLRVRFRRGTPDFLEAPASLRLRITEAAGTRFTTAVPAPAPVISVEDSGPVRACVCVRGLHASESGVTAFPYVLRFHFLADRSDIRLFHTFVFDQNPDAVQLEEVALELRHALSGGPAPGTPGADEATASAPASGSPVPDTPPESAPAGGGGGGARGEAPVITIGTDAEPYQAQGGTPVRLVQTDDRHFRITNAGAVAAHGVQSPGWACFTGPNGSVGVALRDCAREYPKAIDLDDASITIGLWPAEGCPPMDLRNPFKERPIRVADEAELDHVLSTNPTAGISFKGFGTCDLPSMQLAKRLAAERVGDRPVAYADFGLNTAWGAAKTHELVLSFGEPAEGGGAPTAGTGTRRSNARRPGADQAAGTAPHLTTAARVADLSTHINEPTIAFPDPAYMAATGVLRLAHHKDTGRFADAEQGLADMLRRLALDVQKEGRLYGFFDYGDMVNGHTADGGFTYLAHRDDPAFRAIPVMGSFNNEAQDQPHILWLNALRAADRQLTLFAEAYAEHVEDVDTCHENPLNPSARGIVHYHNQTHWSGGYSISHSQVSGFMLHHYFTGNPRALEAALEAADTICAGVEPCGVVSNRGGTLYREYTGQIMVLLEAYQATWNERYGEAAKRSIQWLLLSQDESGDFPRSVYTGGVSGNEVRRENVCRTHPGGMLCHIFYDARRLFPDIAQDIDRAILKLALHWVWDEPADRCVPESYLADITSVDACPVRLDDTWVMAYLDFHNCYLDPLIALAYVISGDPHIAGYLKHRLDTFPLRASDLAGMREGRWVQGIHYFGGSVPGFLPALVQAQDAGNDLDELRDRWLRERERRGRPVYAGPLPARDELGHFERGTPIDIQPQTPDIHTYTCAVYDSGSTSGS